MFRPYHLVVYASPNDRNQFARSAAPVTSDFKRPTTDSGAPVEFFRVVRVAEA